MLANRIGMAALHLYVHLVLYPLDVAIKIAKWWHYEVKSNDPSHRSSDDSPYCH